jgi:hypothetical protein
VIAGFAVLLLVFRAGAEVGARKARFSYRWGEQYHRNFGGPKGGFLHGGLDRDFIETHGAAGTVLSVDNVTVVMNGRDDVERIVRVSDRTVVKRGSRTIAMEELQADDRIVVIGEPNSDGQIEAKFIRVFPPRDRWGPR